MKKERKGESDGGKEGKGRNHIKTSKLLSLFSFLHY